MLDVVDGLSEDSFLVLYGRMNVRECEYIRHMLADTIWVSVHKADARMAIIQHGRRSIR